MAAVAVLVVNSPSRRLSRMESEFGVALAALRLAAGQHEQSRHRSAQAWREQFLIPNFPLPIGKAARPQHLFLDTAGNLHWHAAPENVAGTYNNKPWRLG